MIRHENAPTTRPRFVAGRVAIAVFACLAISVAGCQFFRDAGPRKLNPFATDSKPEMPDRMMVIWSDTVLHQPQMPGVRGFGGRVYFYRGEEPDPVVVDGGLVVYAFDSDDLSSDATRPEKKYVFTADQLPEHMSHTDLGASYSIWLPWDEIGGPNRKLSLVVRFEGREGGVVISKPTMKLLPGVGKYVKAPEGKRAGDVVAHATGIEDPNDRSSRVALTGHADRPTDDGSQSNQPRRPSMTIDVPPSFHRHLRRDTRFDASPTESLSNENLSNESVREEARTGSDSAATGSPSDSKTANPDRELRSDDDPDRESETATPDAPSKRGHRGRPRQFRRTNGTPDGDAIPAPTRGIHRPAGWLTPSD